MTQKKWISYKQVDLQKDQECRDCGKKLPRGTTAFYYIAKDPKAPGGKNSYYSYYICFDCQKHWR